MKARLVVRRRVILRETAFAEMVLWQVPSPVADSRHFYKYSLALVSQGVCVLRYDNEAGKGDHVHTSADERPYSFSTPDQLVADFLSDVDKWTHEHGDP